MGLRMHRSFNQRSDPNGIEAIIVKMDSVQKGELSSKTTKSFYSNENGIKKL